MAESALRNFREEVANDPATDRLKQELQSYLQARAFKAVSGLGSKLGEGVGKLADPGSGGPGALVGSLAKGGQALSEGKSPAQAAMAVGTSHVKEMVKDKVKGLFGKGRKSGGGKSKSVTIVEDIDVGVPVREAYDQWTQFQEFSTFAKGVVSVEKADDTSSNWKVKVAKSTRSLKASVTEQIPDERISWTTDGAKGSVKGVVTFHKITDNLTRVLLVLEYFPGGFFEKTGNIWRAQGRRARLDLKLYRKFIMMRGEATDGWRGEIRDGEVVVEHDDAVEEEERAGEESESSESGSSGTEGSEAPEGEYDDEDRPSDEDESGEEYEDEDVEDEDPEGEYDEDYEPEGDYDDQEEDEEEEEDAEAESEGEYDDEYEPEEEYEDDADDAEEEDERGRRTVSAGR
ncbi:SRPBCC family protein [Streptomyces sp. WMMB 322]|uniref:SRPBCC family protein n=1 Tax=Streptomyces sp. WMMB 322 TaxID=1286821 RepID=UPI0006E3136B|nr:SRPBCC family protein [Streptomyces sp. WMMB 322]SCK52219.1 Polyketide cyclase / dehydrase and lipid transport [Streptomyces sp. WMMB 322]